MLASKRLLIGIAPMLAVAALALEPAVANAAAHYYRNGSSTPIPEGEKVPILEWGKLTLEPEPTGCDCTTCDNSAGGYIENPIGGGSGAGKILRFATWNCTNGECPAGEIEVGGKKYEKEFEIIYPLQDFPWPSVLAEEAGLVRTNYADVVMELGCFAHGLTRAAAGEGGSKGAGENEQFVLPSGGKATETCVTDETHILAPKEEKGTNSGANPSKLVFDEGAGKLNCAGGAFEGKIRESLKVMGYKGSELITAH
jgi:hypothetical protein